MEGPSALQPHIKKCQVARAGRLRRPCNQRFQETVQPYGSKTRLSDVTVSRRREGQQVMLLPSVVRTSDMPWWSLMHISIREGGSAKSSQSKNWGKQHYDGFCIHGRCADEIPQLDWIHSFIYTGMHLASAIFRHHVLCLFVCFANCAYFISNYYFLTLIT